MAVSVSYRLVGHGWAECTIVIDEQRAFVTASYLSDALGDFVSATARIVEGHSEATFSFAEEPGEFRWRLLRTEPDRLRVVIVEFSDLWRDQPDEEGTVLIDANCRLRTFAGAVLSETQRLLELHGVDGYLGEWRNSPFPVEQSERLRRVLRESKR